ncbi:hypothetical protein [Mycoplasma sp. 4404]|uniref:hypothetical protein n=1 Tax=Mycoplasma sp. 4404 TaxID=3108530 RepID=UPI002B1DE399|nr:hypothetical protein [Mycoplasma sp. 4404]MEA4162456.1 hypothetical protein [Mycoplasma sp. 4404]
MYKFGNLNIRLKDVNSILKHSKINEIIKKVNSIHNNLVLNFQNTDDEETNVLKYIDDNLEFNLELIKAKVEFLKSSKIDTLVVIADGESYLTTKAIYDFIFNNYLNNKPAFNIIFTQNNISPEVLTNQLSSLIGQKFAIYYISKSAISIESSVSFREYRKLLEANLKKSDSIEMLNALITVASTEADNILNKMAKIHNYLFLKLPTNIPERYVSIFDPSSLFVLEFLNFNSRELIETFVSIIEKTLNTPIKENIVFLTAIFRYIFARYNNKTVEVINDNDFILDSFVEYVCSLYNSSENKEKKGYLTIKDSVNNTNSLDSDFSITTNIVFKNKKYNLNQDNKKFDQLGLLGTKGENQPNFNIKNNAFEDNDLIIEFDEISINNLAHLFAFFQFVAILSSLLFGVDPLSQPGVEVYKHNIYNALLK